MKNIMDVNLIIKIAGIGVLVAVACQILSKSGRDDTASLVSIAGVIIVLSMLVGKIGEVFSGVKSIFGL